MQKCNNNTENIFAPWSDIADFIDHTYTTLKVTNKYCWFAIDAVQGEYNENRIDRPTALFTTSSGEERKLNIPIVTMEQILRNSKEVVDVLHSARNTQIEDLELNPTTLLSDIVCGHHITSQVVVCHQLKQRTDKKHREPFLCLQ